MLGTSYIYLRSNPHYFDGYSTDAGSKPSNAETKLLTACARGPLGRLAPVREPMFLRQTEAMLRKSYPDFSTYWFFFGAESMVQNRNSYQTLR